MDPTEDWGDLKTLLRRAVVVLRNEPDLRREILALLGLVPIAVTVVAGFDNGFALRSLLDGAGLGIVLAVVLSVIVLGERLSEIYPDVEFGQSDKSDDDDDTDESSDDPVEALRQQYLDGVIDHDTFEERLDAVLAAPPGEAYAVAVGETTPADTQGNSDSERTDPIEILQARFARGELDPEEYEERLEALRETDVEAERT